MTTSRRLFTFLLIPALLIFTASAFANQKGWENRPLAPEFAKAPQEEENEGAASNAKSSGSTKKREKWDAFRFISQSSKFITMPKPPLPFITKRPTKVSPGDLIWSSDSNANVNRDLKFTFAPLDDVVMGGVSSSTFSKGR